MALDLYELVLDGLPDGTRVLEFESREACSALYEIAINLIVPKADGDQVALDGLLGQRGTLQVLSADGSPREQLTGLVMEARLVHAQPRYALYEVVLRPKLWELGLGSHSRVWVDQAIPDVLAAVLQANGLAAGEDYELSLSGRYPVMPHVCQYRESDLAFVQRWCEREGIAYYFDARGAREKLVLVDAAAAYARAPAAPVRFVPLAGGDVSGVEALHAFRARTARGAAEVRTRDYDYLRPAVAIAGRR
jgi:type VI secretion system secreted protein VgrG